LGAITVALIGFAWRFLVTASIAAFFLGKDKNRLCHEKCFIISIDCGSQSRNCASNFNRGGSRLGVAAGRIIRATEELGIPCQVVVKFQFFTDL
jgi:hypothetical protein